MTSRETMAEMIAQIKATSRLEEVCQRRGVDLRSGYGERFEGCCPFHADRSPSFHVYVHTQRYYCFGCGAQGDVIDFVQALDGCSFLEALEHLMPEPRQIRQPARQQTMRSPKLTSLKTHQDQRPDHSTILTQALSVYHDTLLHQFPVQEYLASRGISLATIQRCKLGYADGTTFRTSLFGNGQRWHQARQAGLLTGNGKEWLSGRLIIPDLRGNDSTWMIGRALPTPLHPICKPSDKYLGLALPKPLLGYDRALQTLQGVQHAPHTSLQAILVVEGAIDYLLAQEWQLPFLCVALLGTHPSRQQWHALLHLQEVSRLPLIDWHDGDERGRAASLQMLQRLRQRPARPFPEIASIKDLADLGTRPDGYARLIQAWHAIGDGGEA